MSDIRISGSGGLVPSNPIDPSDVTEIFNSISRNHASLPSKANLDQAAHMPPAVRIAVDRAWLDHLEGG